MPRTAIQLFRENNGDVPLQDWLDELEAYEPRAHRKCVERILLLSQLGNELRRPIADILRDGIRELRAKVGNVNYRILYFFHGSNLVCLSHGLTKENEIPDAEIEAAIAHKKLVERDPQSHIAEFEV